MSAHAEQIDFCTFDADDNETGRYPLTQRTGDLFHACIPGIAPGTLYGLRASGPFQPHLGHRFNPHKLLADPYASQIDRPFRLHPALFEAQSATDSSPFMPKCVALPPPPPAAPPAPLDDQNLIIYELHVRGFTMRNEAIPPEIRGTFAALAHPASIAYLQQLGITAIEILPCAAWIDERHLPPLGRTNYWGYNPICFMAPDPRLAPGGFAEIAAAIATLHHAGIATIIDVVFNHSGESDELGPTVSFRGLDNATCYRLAPNDPSRYVNDAGCGNILAADHPAIVRLIMDALRLWATATGADGFRFDLATTLGRTATGFSPTAPLLTAIQQDPILRRKILIAEPWDIGANGYQLGNFGAPWAEWNDRFRDTVRRFWRGDQGMLGDLATRLAGSADVFSTSRRPPAHSINFVTAHDGFTLRDLVSYLHKRNDDNGEHNRDGTDDNISWNCGTEGPAADPAITAARAADMRALLATLLFARGTPMLAMGDECGRTQLGNNNAYAQDNDISWLNWNAIDTDLLAATRRLIALRRATPALHANRMLAGTPCDETGLPDVAWRRPDGAPMQPRDWENPQAATLVAVLYAPPTRATLILHAAHQQIDIVAPPGAVWDIAFDTADPGRAGQAGTPLIVAPRSVVLLLERAPDPASPRTGASDTTVRRLAAQAGLALHWWDVAGVRHVPSIATLQSLLTALRLPTTNESTARDSLATLAARRDLRPLPANLTVTADTASTLRLGPATGGRDRWLLIEAASAAPLRRRVLADEGAAEAVEAADGRRFTARRIALPPLPAGRYRLSLEGVDPITHITSAPAHCHLPAALANGGRAWGLAGHLYSMRRNNDQGIGDFSALADLAAIAGREGAALLGLNPMHALFPANRVRASPYHPADRRFLDPIYIDVTALGRLAEAPAVRAALAAEAPAFHDLAALPIIDYPTVWQSKQHVLAAAFGTLAADPAACAALDAFIAAGGAALRDFTAWETISARHGSNWRDWPEDLRTPGSPGVAPFLAAHVSNIRFSAFQQQLAEAALAETAAAARAAGVGIGLYRDLAVGCAPDGAEAWSDQARLLTGASVGAPPDPIGPLGQVWHLPPPDPLAMADDGFRSYAALLAANMRHAGALRIDHVMGLTRLFLVPAGGSARDGTYLTYPLPDLLGQVCLQSTRAGCLVVGEDLGTVPPDLRVALGAASVLSYRVLWFEQDDTGFRPPPDWPAQAAACVSTHDLPTFSGWWHAADIDELAALALLDPAAALDARAATKSRLLALLHAQNLIGPDPTEAELLLAVHALIARTPAALALVQIDDLAGERIGVNLPGTDLERPNWRRRLAVPAAAFAGHPVLSAMRRERPLM